ncbi:triphosphoribosyl-dephospho-CoA synthase MdcB [Rhodoferax koreense]|uniref:Probable 2-(5''-triphosphoribosyl)-3'-dephosphocoenzyme-A synthase n=1 Tax=Rhodoferax koreensis TaxID=1842727 RepID=A0A1P8JUY4_9BURK|nr:triphosphoribosyl-dephospho-CoA synthase MdcB [Rhodoferax koreense]APW37548.1 triphosphoribosyl-dephospho-CoA synthase MdcB [Rhodoferax koreense]
MYQAADLDTAVHRLAREAVRALYAELVLEPKPGLVSLRDNGSHSDMHAGHFMRSLFALRHYFARMVRAGAEGAPFAELEQLGQQAEARMLAATGGVNTHRGAIFCLGLLCASAGWRVAAGLPLDAEGLRQSLRARWGAALRARAERASHQPPRSNGQRAAREHGLHSAGDEAADAFPVLFEVSLPALQRATAAGWPDRRARVQALFATMAVLDDTNLVHRGGIRGLHDARQAAQRFLDEGGAAGADWRDRARAIHAAFVARRLSPGGAADLLGAACWLAQVTAPASSKRLPTTARA